MTILTTSFQAADSNKLQLDTLIQVRKGSFVAKVLTVLDFQMVPLNPKRLKIFRNETSFQFNVS